LSAWRTLQSVLRIPFYRRLTAGLAGVYLILFLFALRDITLGGDGVRLLTADVTRMFDRTGATTFEAIAQLTLPGITIAFSPLNLVVGTTLSVLAGLNLAVTYMAFKQPRACRFNRSTGVLASLPALVAGGACCAPTIILILGVQVSSLFMTTFEILIPASLVVLVVTLKLILDRTDVELVGA